MKCEKCAARFKCAIIPTPPILYCSICGSEGVTHLKCKKRYSSTTGELFVELQVTIKCPKFPHNLGNICKYETNGAEWREQFQYCKW